MILTARWVAPVAHPLIEQGFVEIEGTRIARVGRAAELPDDATRGGVIDFGQAIITPGLVNPHTHLELGCYAGLIAPQPLWPWIGELVGLRRQPEAAERERRAVEDSAWRSLRAGITCVGDISRTGTSWSALHQIPIRKVCFVELLALADEPARDVAELRAAVQAVNEDELLTAGISPHAPYSVGAEQVAAAIRLAGELGRPWTMHLAETPEEVAFLRGDSSGLPAMLTERMRVRGVASPQAAAGEYLDRVSRGAEAGCIAHMNYAGPADFERVAAAGHAVVYCPRAHRFFGHEAYPLAAMRAAGVRVAIGTDSPASNDGVSLLDEVHCLRERVAEPPASAELLRMITIEAAAALRLEGAIGSIEVGKQADLAVFPVDAGEGDPVGALIGLRPQAVGVWVAGTRVQ